MIQRGFRNILGGRRRGRVKGSTGVGNKRKPLLMFPVWNVHCTLRSNAYTLLHTAWKAHMHIPISSILQSIFKYINIYFLRKQSTNHIPETPYLATSRTLKKAAVHQMNVYTIYQFSFFKVIHIYMYIYECMCIYIYQSKHIHQTVIMYHNQCIHCLSTCCTLI